jgi:hypothetical protein
VLQELDDKYGFLSSDLQWVTHIDNERKVRGLWPAMLVLLTAGGRSLHAMCCSCSFPSEKAATFNTQVLPTSLCVYKRVESVLSMVQKVVEHGVCLCVQVLVAERGPLVFVFNWHPHDDYEGLKVAAPTPGKSWHCCAVCEV